MLFSFVLNNLLPTNVFFFTVLCILGGGSWILSKGTVIVRRWSKELLMFYPLRPGVSPTWPFIENFLLFHEEYIY